MRLPMVALLALVSCSTLSLEAELHALIASHGEATVAISVRDAGFSLDINSNRVFHAASTMKVPVMIELFRRQNQGKLSMDSTLVVENSFKSIVDGTFYSIEDDSDDTIYQRLGERMTMRQLLHQMMTVSSNLATNLLIDTLSADSVRKTAARLGAPTMNVLRGVEDLKAFDRKLNNTTTSRDLAELLYRLMKGDAVSPEADRAMIEVMAKSVFDSMIPAGLPEGTRVVNKTGWITAIHHDAAIVYPAGQTPYVMVVLTEGLEDQGRSAALGADIARTVHAALRDGT